MQERGGATLGACSSRRASLQLEDAVRRDRLSQLRARAARCWRPHTPSTELPLADCAPLRTHASEAAQQPPQQPSLTGRPVHLVSGSLRLGPLADGRARGNRTPDRRVRAISRCFYSRFRGGADVQSGYASLELELASYRRLVPSAAPRDPLRSTLARQRRSGSLRSAQYGLVSLRWPARAHICTL